MKFQYPILSSLIVCLISISVFAQHDSPEKELKNILDRAEKATGHYSEVFKNLTAAETKTFEDYDKRGRLKETRKIKSTFIVYQSPKNGEVNEFRNVLEYNGKNVARSDREMEKLFVKLAENPSVGDEWRNIVNDGIRFDGKSSAWGMTLWQEAPLGKLRAFFEFEMLGKERIEGREVVVIEYRQTKPTLLIKFNPTEQDWIKEPSGREYHASVSGVSHPFNPHINGKIWLDAETSQIWRNEFKVFIKPSKMSKPVTALEIVCEYQPHEFNILAPKKFVYTSFNISGSGENDLTVIKDRMMLFEYSKFSEFKTETKDYKIAGEN